MCGIPSKIGKLLLFTINFAVWICGAAIMGVGIALAVDSDLWSEWFGIAEGMSDDLFAAAVYMMISIGVLLFLVGFVGCCGVCKGNTCMLQTYIILVSILLVLELVGGILAIVFKDSLTESIQAEMVTDIQTKYQGVNKTDASSLGWNSMQLSLDESIKLEMSVGLKNKYQGVNKTDATSLSWNNMQQSLKCCGAIDSSDYNGSVWDNSFNPDNDPVPITCCSGTLKSENSFYYLDPAEKITCMTEANDFPADEDEELSQFYDTGCYEALNEWIDEKSKIIIGVLLGLGAVQLFGLIGACCVKSSLEDEV